MKTKSYLIGLLLLPAFVHAQGFEKCADFVPVTRQLNDNFLNQKTILKNAEETTKKDQDISVALHKKYEGCEKQPGIIDVLKLADETYENAEKDRKNAMEAFGSVDKEIRKIIEDARGRQVACLYLDQSYGNLGSIVTVSYWLKDEVVQTMSKNDPLQLASR